MATSQQAGFFDRTVEDPALEQAILDIEANGAAHKKYVKAVKTRKRRFLDHKPTTGERIRVGTRIIQQKTYAGGPITIGKYNKSGVGKVSVAPVTE